MDLPQEYSFQGMTVPKHTMHGLHEYITHHTPKGSFLKAVLSNDLMGAASKADDKNLHNLPAIVGFLYNYAPGNCWGSPKAYQNWIAKKEGRNP